MSSGEANVWQPRTIIEVTADTKLVTQLITALANQTLFTITDFAYTVGTGALQVYKNGNYLTPNVDFVEQTDTTFSLIVPSTVGDQVVAVGNTGISGAVDVRDTDIFLTNHQTLRDYAGTEDTIYIQGTVTKGDGGENFFQKFTGAAPGTYVDDNLNVIVPTGGDGSTGWLSSGSIKRVDSIYNLPVAGKAGQVIEVSSFYVPNLALADPYDRGGDKFVWEAATTKISANGITKVDPAAFNGWDGSAMATTADYFDATDGQGGSAITGNGIWSRQVSGLLNVEAAGALDLAADSTDSLQALIDLISAEGGGRCFVSDALYNHTGLVWKTGVGFLGESRHNSTIQYTPATGDAITGGADISRFGLENIFLNSNNSSTGWAVFFDLSTVRQPRIVNCVIGGFLKGVRIDDGLQGVIDQLFIAGQGKTASGGIGLQLGESGIQSGTTWDVRSVYATTLEKGIINWASLSKFKQIICEVCNVAVTSNVSSTWDVIWSAANDTFWEINNSGINITSFRRGGATTDFVYDGATSEQRTTINPEAADINPTTAECHKFVTFKTYRDGKYLIHDEGTSDTAGNMPPHANFEAALNFWGDAEAELKIGVPRQTAAVIGKNFYLQAGGAKSGETDNDGGSLVLQGGVATGNGRSDVRIETAGGGASGAADRIPTERWVFRTDGHFRPAIDNTYDVGSAVVAPKDIYSNNAVTVTSDGRLKTEGRLLSDKEMAAWARVQPVIYQFLAAVEEKGSNARLHAGHIAQQVEAAFKTEGLDVNRYGLFCRDDIVEEYEVEVRGERQVVESIDVEDLKLEIIDGVPTQISTMSTVDRPLFENKIVIDESGEPVLSDGKPVFHPIPVMEEGMILIKKKRIIGDKLSLRYAECAIFEAAYQRLKVQELSDKVKVLEGKV